MPLLLSDIYEVVDRSIYDIIRKALVELNYLPDIMDTVRYTDDDAGVANWKADLAAIVTAQGFAVEVFGAGSNEKKYEKKVPRIVYVPKRVIPGDLGGQQGRYYVKDGDTFKAVAQPPQTTQRQFEIHLVCETAKQLRLLESIIANVLAVRGYVPFYNNPEKTFFVEQTTYREYPDLEYGLLEHIYGYKADDLWDKIDISEVPVSPLKEVTVETRIEGTSDTDPADSTLTID